MALVSLGTSTISILNPILNLSTVRDNKISNNLIKIRMDNFELNSSTSIPNNTTSTTTLQIGKITGNKISYVDYELSSGITVTNTAVGSTLRVSNDSKVSTINQFTLDLELNSGITVPNTAVGSKLLVKNDSKISVFDKKTLKLDQLKPSEFKITGNLYNAGSLPTVPLSGLIKNYKPTARPRPEKLRVNFAFTNTQILAITQLYSLKAITSKIPASKQEKLSPTKVSRLTVKSTSTLLTSYSYWV